ncbi:3-oxoacyl-ACP reductase family protein [Pseudoduganella sp. UC29_106]|uniref:3-oxoacyl-ACP reductase family protein n=1 Tax=Pseudoduganella sp. UC29_106 TaxID=3374553 RepID=UPI003756AC6F
MNKNLQGKVALVMGGTRGIGAAIVERLAREGASVAFTYAASAGTAQDLEATITASGGRALAIQADSGDAEAVRGAVAQAAAHFGRLDILVNNAGILRLAPMEDFPLEDFDRMVDVNVRGLFVAAQAAVKHMGEGGRIISIGSIASVRVAFPTSSVYSMTKGAVAAMVRGMALDLAPRGITVNNVQPGPTETDMNPSDGPHAEAIKGMIPLRRVGRPEEIAGMVAYLAGPEAAFVTGASLTIDGGYTA